MPGLPTANRGIWQSMRISLMRLMLLRAVTGCSWHGKTSHSPHSETSHFCCTENCGYVTLMLTLGCARVCDWASVWQWELPQSPKKVSLIGSFIQALSKNVIFAKMRLRRFGTAFFCGKTFSVIKKLVHFRTQWPFPIWHLTYASCCSDQILASSCIIVLVCHSFLVQSKSLNALMGNKCQYC